MADINFSQKHIERFEELGVMIVYLFGSRARGDSYALSDFDIGVVFEEPQKIKENQLKVYNKLYDIFTDVLPSDYLKKRFEMREHEFDLVFLQFAPIRLQLSAIQEGQIIYEKPPGAHFTFQEYVMKRHADLSYFYQMKDQAILERI